MVNEHLLRAIQEAGLLESDEMVTEAVLVFATANSNDETAYGQVFLAEGMPIHHAIGLLQITLGRILHVEEIEE